MYLVIHSRQISAFAWMAVSISAAPASPVAKHTFPQSGMERFSASVYSCDHLVLKVQHVVMILCSRIAWLTLHLQYVCHRMLHRRPLTSSEGCAFGNSAHSNIVVVTPSYDRALGGHLMPIDQEMPQYSQACVQHSPMPAGMTPGEACADCVLLKCMGVHQGCTHVNLHRQAYHAVRLSSRYCVT